MMWKRFVVLPLETPVFGWHILRTSLKYSSDFGGGHWNVQSQWDSDKNGDSNVNYLLITLNFGDHSNNAERGNEHPRRRMHFGKNNRV